MTRIKQVWTARPAQDGAGVKMWRIHDFSGGFDPFLMLDELKADAEEDYIGGFPPHPHRGFETLTYILHGGLTHEDSLGHRGEVQAGDAQWMSAASGVIHSEMPLLDQQGLHAFQLWINLPASRKMDRPQYRDLRAEQMGRLSWDQGELIAIAGQWQTDQGELQGGLTQLGEGAALADLRFTAAGQLELELADQHALWVYVYQGALAEGVASGQLAQLHSDHGRISLSTDQPCGLLLLAGAPLQEPIAHYGPFVMNTEQEIRQAVADYQSGRLVSSASQIAE
ncbi:pirin family protein [Marinospirillum sp. MEB164]|uniref:Pirin family protein n=1 Tax=Marinospirillum alkalitolerans TaxID=3123374 RepID=A0ABW8PXN3_9GAMM